MANVISVLRCIISMSLSSAKDDIIDRVRCHAIYIDVAVILQLYFLARSANLSVGLYILPMFFLYFLFFIFLMVDFPASIAQTLMEQSSPKFQDW